MTDNLQIIPSKQIVQNEKLGEGGFGIVYKGTWDQHQVAIKRLRLHKLSDELKQEFLREAKVMAGLNNPAIVRLYGICNEAGKYGMILEFLPKGDLFQLLQSKQQLPWNPLRWQIAIDIASGLRYLHSKDILHRDLKSLNILLTEKYRAKITDFGLSKLKFQTKSTSTNRSAGSIPWMAPELFKRGVKITRAIDIYAFGMVLWELTARKIPFSDAHNPDVIPTWIVQGEREDIPKDCPEKVAELIRQCWAQDPEKRPIAEAVLGALTKARPQPTKAPSITTQVQTPLKNEMTVAVQQKEVPGPKEYKAAWKLMQQCKYEEALPLLKQAAEAKYPPTFLRLGWLYAEGGRIGPRKTEKSDRWTKQAAHYFSWFEEHAKKENAHAQFNLGYCYFHGLGTKEDRSLALKLFRLAANQGDAEAQYYTGDCFFRGLGTVVNRNLAQKYYKQAATQKHARALWCLSAHFSSGNEKAFRLASLSAECGYAKGLAWLGTFYYKGEGVKEDLEKALYYFKCAAEKGFPEAQMNVGGCYFKGVGVEQDKKEGLKYWRMAATQGHASAKDRLHLHHQITTYEKGLVCANACKYKEALPHLQKAAEAGYPPAYLLLGWLYEKGGRIGPKNRSISDQWYRKAGKSLSWFKEKQYSNTDAQLGFAHCQYYGYGYVSKKSTPRGRYDAKITYEIFADKGNVDAKIHLGHICRLGSRYDSKKSFKDVAQAYRDAASSGNAFAQVVAGEYLLDYWIGRLKRIDEIKFAKEAFGYFQKAAQQDCADGQFLLGRCYASGYGVAKDVEEAKKYFQLATDQGHEEAKKRLSSCSIM